MEINKKGKIGQFFCNHKNTGWFVNNTLFQSLRGEERFNICKDCGKIIGKYLAEYEGNGFK